jgi:hypothetical protein
VEAVGSRTIEKALDFIEKHAQGDRSIKAYGTYEEVYADKVNHPTDQPFDLNTKTLSDAQDVDAVYIG